MKAYRKFSSTRISAKAVVRFACLCLISGISISLFAQMLNPAMDPPNQPFSYYSQPTDVIGVMDAPTATLVSPEGFFYTGFGELMFFTGNPPVAIQQRIKTLLHGYLPVIEYGFLRDGLYYHFTAFSATLDGTPSGTLVDFVRVSISNKNSKPATGWISTGMRYEGGINTTHGFADNRYRRPAVAAKLGAYSQPGQTFDANWKYSSDKDTVQRDGQVLYFFPASPSYTVRYTLKADVSTDGVLQPQVLPVLPTTPVGIVQYKVPLQAGQTVTLDWKLPVIPITANSPTVAKVRAASFDSYLSDTTHFWEALLQKGIDIEVPEDKVNNTFKTSLIYCLLARSKIGTDYVQTVNQFNYHKFWLRDVSNITRMYDLSGYPQYAAQVLRFFPRWQQPDGNFVSQGGQFDGIGQTLWIYGAHYRITHDQAFADSVFPSVVRAVQWIQQARQNDSLHLLPATKPGDNEAIEGHITGQNFWALDGLEGAITLAKGTGHTRDAANFQNEYQDYRKTFVNVLDSVTEKTGGYIPPGLDGQHGQDWGNMMAVYPGIVLNPHDQKVTATLNATRAKYQEGIMTYDDGRYLHHYLTLKNTETEIVRGDQQLAVGELYAILMHTSSTHAGFEYKISPWGNRDFGDDLSPHGWFAAEYRTALRNMLVREQDFNLHLFSVISPEWVQPGKEIVMHHAPTDFGTVDCTLRFLSDTQAQMTLRSVFVDPPKQIILHLPWFMNTSRVTADGKNLPITNYAVILPATVKLVSIDWSRRAGVEPMSYQRAVEDYKAEYLKRYQEFIQTGKQYVAKAQ